MTRIGPILHGRDGHCTYSPTLDQRICGEVAAWHVWVGDDIAVFACRQHIREITVITEQHEPDNGCLRESALWVHGDPSYCSEVADDAWASLLAEQVLTR